MIKINIEQGSEAWFEYRLGRFTASKFSTLMSGETTKGYSDLISQIAGEILSGEMEETYTSADMERGKELEPYARKEYESIFDVEVEQVGFVIPDENDKLFEWVGVSPDGMLNDGLLEIKCPKFKTHLSYIKKNVLPNEYKWQVQGQLLFTDAKWCDFMSYYPKVKPFIIRVLPDEEMQKQLIERLEKAIEDVKKEIEIYKAYDFEH